MDLAIFYLPGHNNVELLIITHRCGDLDGRGLFELWKELLIRAAKTTRNGYGDLCE